MRDAVQRLAILACFLFAGCSTISSIDEIAQRPKPSDKFSAALMDAYIELAYAQADAHQWVAAGIFRDKAADVANGLTVLPEEPADWMAGDMAHIDELVSERARLVALLNDGEYQDSPELKALAQANFDCWVVGGAENVASDTNVNETPMGPGQRCRQSYLTATDEILVSCFCCHLKVRERRPEFLDYSVYFDGGTAELSEISKSLLGFVVEDLRSFADLSLRILGHTDTAGTAADNLALSRMRAENVARYLVASGFEPERIEVLWFGESDIEIPTGDGIDEPMNRRVDLVVVEESD